jgi:hypothetical protein
VAQDEQQRVQRIKEYVLVRLRGELSAAPRGAQARLAKRLGVSGAHLSNMLSKAPTRQPGEDFRRKVAAHWGMTYAQLEALATGEEMPPASTAANKPPPNFYAALSSYAWSLELPAELRQLVTEQAKQYHVVLDRDLSVCEWTHILTGLEREALEHTQRGGRKVPSPPASTGGARLKGH